MWKRQSGKGNPCAQYTAKGMEGKKRAGMKRRQKCKERAAKNEMNKESKEDEREEGGERLQIIEHATRKPK